MPLTCEGHKITALTDKWWVWFQSSILLASSWSVNHYKQEIDRAWERARHIGYGWKNNCKNRANLINI